MTIVELHLDEMVLQRARRLAESHGYTLEEVFTLALEQLEAAAVNDPLLGLFSDEPELMDRVLEDAMLARERDALRPPDG